MDGEQMRSAEDLGLSVVCGSVAFDDAGLRALGINAQSSGDDIVRAAHLLSDAFDVDLLEAAGSLADLVHEMKWFQEAD